MDFLSKAFAQFRELFITLSPGARIMAGLLLTVVVVSLAYLFQYGATGADAYLLSGQTFSAGELTAMEAAFGDAGLSDYEVEGNRVRIPRGRQAAYMAALTGAGALPANFGDYLFRATADSGPFVPARQRDELIKVAKERELALIVRSMKGIEKAAVHYDSQIKPGLKRERISTASVSVKRLGTQPLEERVVPMIRDLVAGSIAGLTPEAVTVIDLNGRAWRGGESSPSGSGLDDPYFNRMRSYRQEIEERVTNALSYVPGVVVSAHVELDKELDHTEESVEVDPKPINISVREESKTLSSQQGAPAGRPGVQAQSPNQPANLSTAGGGNQTDEEMSNREETNTVSHSSQRRKLIGMTPKRIAVTVGVPSSYFEQIWRDRNPSPAGQEPKKPDANQLTQIETEATAKIRSHVVTLIPKPAEVTDPTSLVTVTAFTHLADEPPPEPGVGPQALAWLGEYWTTAGMVGLALFSLLMLRSMVRGAPAMVDVTTPSWRAGAAEAPAAEATAEKSEPPRVRRLGGSGPSLRDDLAAMVRDDPDAAVNILRGWIGKAG